jgi:D-amino-acid dehydrogenase
MPVKDASMAHQVSLTDDEYKLVFSRLGDRLRIAGTAELNGYDRDLNRVRCEAIVRRVEELFPGAGDTSSRRSSGPACARPRRATCRSSAARSCPTCS